MEIAVEPTVAEMLAAYKEAILDCFMMPNEILPERHHNRKEGYVSLHKLDQNTKNNSKQSQQKSDKEERAKRIKNYRNQAATLTDQDWRDNKPFELEYDVDDNKLYERQLRWGKCMITKEDIDQQNR